MENSDSDTEGECFESAEESLDECEGAKSAATKWNKSESEVSEPVCDNTGSAPQPEKYVSSNLMSYRKRPERLKRYNSNTTRKPIPKLSSDAVFKPDKIVPDAFFQDITNNLSKNINKSLSTLQQKSSNVKDLILNSLPVSSVNDDEGFSYDDVTVQVLPVESKIPTTKTDPQSKSNSNQLIGHVLEENSKKQYENYGEGKITETNLLIVDGLNKSNKDRKPPDIRPGTLESSEGYLNLKGSILDNKVEREVSNFVMKEKEDVLDYCISRADGDSHEEKKETMSDINRESLQVSIGEFCHSSNINTLHEEEGANANDNNMELVNFSYQTDEKNEITEVVPTESIESKIESESEENCGYKKFLETAELKNTGVNNFANSDENELNFQEESKVGSNCNLKELKTVLENIVNDKKNMAKDEKKVEVILNSNDGWDDFDFSDNEVENNDISKTEFGGMDFRGKSNKAVVEERKSLSDNLGGEKLTNIVIKSANTDLIKKHISNLKHESKKDLNIIKKPKQVFSAITEATDTPSDDTWHWDDDWDKTPENKAEGADITPTKNPISDKIKSESSDISKWTGWDTFAQKPQEKQGNWSLGSWGVDMLLNKATAVTQGISNVLEAGLGAPDPETLAKMEKVEREKLKALVTEETQEYSGEVLKRNSLTNVNLFPVSGITSLVAGVTSKIVEHSKIQEIGSKVITGGLDTLETFGKKTMEVLQEGDPGLKNKRALLMGNNKPVLSQVLREAREEADREMKKAEEKEIAKKCHFETLFDGFQGMVHLEALEMLSKQCELKLEQIRSEMNSEEQEDLNGILEEVEQLCSLDEFELDLKSSVFDFKTVLQTAVEPLKNEISVHKIIQIHENVNKWIEMSSGIQCSLIIVNQKLVSTLAELAAATVQQFHKSGELLSVKECRQTVQEVDALSRLTNILCMEINRLCERFMLLPHSKSSDCSCDSLSCMTEKITLVMNNSTSYIRQAFCLLIPIIQLGAAA